MDRLTDWLESQDFYELCQAYRHARDGIGGLPGMQSAAEAFEALKRQIKVQSLSQEAVRDEALEMPEDAETLEWEFEFSDTRRQVIRRVVWREDYDKLRGFTIRALKREPNAAGWNEKGIADIGVLPGEVDVTAEPAPAAPDVASMVKRRLQTAAEHQLPSTGERVVCMTPKQKTLKKYPGAVSHFHDYCRKWFIYAGFPPREIGIGDTEEAAWISADERQIRKSIKRHQKAAGRAMLSAAEAEGK